MNNRNLLCYFAVGPTYRQRTALNVIKNKESYDLFDVLVQTDLIEDECFDSLRSMKNVFIRDIETSRIGYQDSFVYEKLPTKTKNEEEYARQFSEKNEKVPMPSSLWRFSLLTEGIEKYDFVFFCNCDVVCNCKKEDLENLKSLFESLNNDSCIGHGIFDYTDSFISEAKNISNKFKIPLLRQKLLCNDGNFFCYSFRNKEKIKKLFDLMHAMTLEVLYEGNEDLYKLGNHSMWLVHNEALLSIAYSFLDVDVFPKMPPINSMFEINTYPEDRHWNFFAGDFFHTLSKKEFVEKNYEKLKSFYEERKQKWEY